MSKTDDTHLPQTLPVFPLEGVLLLPRGGLPLNIFEPRYLAMVDDALRTDRPIGMIQPDRNENNANGSALRNVGCAGRITAFQETSDGRYLITLTGIARFEVDDELSSHRGYRRVRPSWGKFKECDLSSKIPDLGVNREKLMGLLKTYFEKNDMSCEWQVLSATPEEHLITALSMICPFTSNEKQALLEQKCEKERAALFIEILEMAIASPTHTTDSSHH